MSQILAFEFTSGVVISGSAAKLEQHFREYIGNKSTVVTEILQKTNQENDKVKPAEACHKYRTFVLRLLISTNGHYVLLLREHYP